MRLEGVVPPMLTPVDGRRGGVDHDALRALTDRLLAGGVDALFPVGTNGEFPSLGREQRRAVVETVVDAAAARDAAAPVLAGCCDTSVAGARSLMADADDAGADAAVVVTPYYFETTRRGVADFLEQVVAGAPLPVVLYNIPAYTDHRLAPATVADLAARDSVVGVKDSSGDLTYFARLLEATPEGFDVLQGTTAGAVPSLDLGADGFVSGVANVLPEVHADLYAAHRRGDRDRVTELVTDAVFPFLAGMGGVPGVPALKHLCGRAGLEVGPPLPPLPTLTDDQRTRLDERCGPVVDAFG